MKKTSYLLVLMFLPWLVSAQEQEASGNLFVQYQVEIVLALSVVVCLVALLAMFVILIAMKSMLRVKQEAEEEVVVKKEWIKAKEGEEHLGFWSRFWNRLNESVPVSKEQAVATGHEYDGIKELDNKLPSWWLYGFFFTILFGVVYFAYYHVFDSGPSQHEAYELSMEKAKEEVALYLASLDNLMDENSVVLTTEAGDVAAGKAIYESNCAVCHAKDGGGGVGPNFTDTYWLHGGDIQSIFKTIKYGVPEKGMISWEAQLSPKKMQQVASFIFTLEGTTPENPKEPQGEPFQREKVIEEEPVLSDSTAVETIQASL
ncbi:MAG: cbb3-type cytochrome c oxidase N-terminal domain-containing protein [Bacteroidota bacterium]